LRFCFKCTYCAFSSGFSSVLFAFQFMGENAVWQDPEGEVRKWQRDTGTAAWGDPEKQSKEIKRWLVPAGKEFESAEGEGGPKSVGKSYLFSAPLVLGKGKKLKLALF
uniref:WWE domain-containing protein n=1 Tax=Gongylonema pulchrum TaxID=637853 RepID=A0A183DD17_9BILA